MAGFAPPAAAIAYAQSDHLDTVRILTNPARQVIWRWDAEPFGLLPPQQDPDGDGIALAFNFRFPGQYYDAETGLHYNYYRDYDPQTGRYVQSDPIGLDGGLNTYAYVDSNPLNWVDDDGLQKRGGGNPRNFVSRPGDQQGGWSYGRFYPRLGDAPTRTASYPVGSSRSQFKVPPRAQQPGGQVCGRDYSGHAFDQMQARGIPPSVVTDTIATGTWYPGSTSSTSQYFSATNNVTVVVNHNTGNTITVRWGPPSGLGGSGGD